MGSEIIVALIGLLGVSVTAAVSYFKIIAEKSKTRQAENEINLQKNALDFSAFMTEWSSILSDLKKLISVTPVDGFLILRAWNGKFRPRWTTAVFQYRDGPQEHVNYIHFELDEDYSDKLKEVEMAGIKRYRVSEMEPESAIRYIYEAESVTEVVWCFIGADNIEGQGRAVSYCSFGTQEKEGFTDAEITKCRVLANRLAGMSNVFGLHNKNK